MGATQRFVMMVDPTERAAWGARAADVGVTTAEFVRRAASVYDPEAADQQRELAALLPELRSAAEAMRVSLAEARSALAYALDPERDREARVRARAEIDDMSIDAVSALIA